MAGTIKPDIRLLIGVLGDASLAEGTSGGEIKKRLGEIFAKINKQPFKVKATLDTGSGIQRSWGSQIKKSLNEISKDKQFAVKVSKLEIGASALNDFKRKIGSVLNTLSVDKGVSITISAKDVGEISSKFKDAGDSAQDAAKKTAEFKAQIETLSHQKATVLKALNDLEKSASTEAEKKDVAELRALYEAYSRSIFEVAEAKEATSQENKEKIENEGRAILGVVDALNKKRETMAEAEAQEQRAAAATRQAIVDSTAESNLYKQIADAILRVQKAQENWTAAKRGKSRNEYAALEGYVTRLNELRDSLGTIPAAQAKSQLAKINSEFKRASQVIADAHENTKTFTERFGGLASKFSVWFSATRVVMTAINTVRKMVQAARELDDAMTQLQIVTRMNNQELQEYSKTAAVAATRIGASISDFVDSTTTFARLGYNTEQASALAEYTSMLKNVGDIDVSEAQDAITSMVKAFRLSVDEIESVMDKLVKTGNNYPISVAQIAEGMTNASSALSAAGNTFEQSVALLTAANTTVQNAAKSSTGLRTIAARLRNTKTELDELGEAMTEGTYEELVAALSKYNVALTDTAGQFRSTYDIIADIAKVWNQLDSMEQAGLATAISGTRQQAVFFSLVEQFREASGAMDDMADSAGTLKDSYDIYMNSVTAHVNQFKAAFQALSATAVDTGFINGIVDAGTKLLTVLNGIAEVLSNIVSVPSTFFFAGLITTFTQLHKAAGRPKETGFTVPAYVPMVTWNELAV